MQSRAFTSCRRKAFSIACCVSSFSLDVSLRDFVLRPPIDRSGTMVSADIVVVIPNNLNPYNVRYTRGNNTMKEITKSMDESVRVLLGCSEYKMCARNVIGNVIHAASMATN